MNGNAFFQNEIKNPFRWGIVVLNTPNERYLLNRRIKISNQISKCPSTLVAISSSTRKKDLKFRRNYDLPTRVCRLWWRFSTTSRRFLTKNEAYDPQWNDSKITHTNFQVIWSSKTGDRRLLSKNRQTKKVRFDRSIVTKIIDRLARGGSHGPLKA